MDMKTRRPARTPEPHIRSINLTDEQITMLAEAIDSHVYWQLSDEQYRGSGAVNDPGSDDDETAATIASFRDLANTLAGGR